MFGEKLINLRKSKNLTQEELSELLNVSRQSVSKWESNIAYPETEKIIKLSEIFGVTVDSLLKEIETLQVNTDSETPQMSNRLTDITENNAFEKADKAEELAMLNKENKKLSNPLKISIASILLSILSVVLIFSIASDVFAVFLLIACIVFFITAISSLLIHFKQYFRRVSALFYWALSIIGIILFAVGLICMSDRFNTVDSFFLELLMLFGVVITILGLVMLFIKGNEK